jgi:hypothetical protein
MGRIRWQNAAENGRCPAGGTTMTVAATVLENSSPLRQVVHIVEDDEQFRLSRQDLFQSLDIESDAFGDAADFFRARRGTSPAASCWMSSCPM